MMQIIYVVIAIGLSAILMFAGVSYFNPNAADKAMTSRALAGQYETIKAAVKTYSGVNNGVVPADMSAFKGFMPGGDVPSFGTKADPFSWSEVKSDNGKPLVCLRVDASRPYAVDAALAFAADEARKGESVFMDVACVSTTPFVQGAQPPEGQAVFINLAVE